LRNRVPKGMRMAGRMGGDRITVKNLVILGVDKENNQLLINGAIPGRRGTLVEVRG
jgi:large subunit ribosomal protein L3